jgi:hypothetical protein
MSTRRAVRFCTPGGYLTRKRRWRSLECRFRREATLVVRGVRPVVSRGPFAFERPDTWQSAVVFIGEIVLAGGSSSSAFSSTWRRTASRPRT